MFSYNPTVNVPASELPKLVKPSSTSVSENADELVENEASIIGKRFSDWDVCFIANRIDLLISGNKCCLGWTIQVPNSAFLDDMTLKYVNQFDRKRLT